jgi:phosphoadenosine phosphosulfate reductase
LHEGVGAVRLGKMHLRWCHQCGVPVLEDATCGLCDGRTVEVKLTPPGDARPAFGSDITKLRGLLDAQFGPGSGYAVIPEGCIVLLNKAPDIDRMDEVIVGGEVVGAVRFELAHGERFLLRPQSATSLAPVISKSWVSVDEGAAKAIRTKKASTLAVGVASCDDGITTGSEVVVLDADHRAVSVGIAKMDSLTIMARPRGTAVKTRWPVSLDEPGVRREEAPWEAAVNANEQVIERRVGQAVGFVKDLVSKSHLPVAVSYSGGKDSLATLLLVLDAGIRPKLLFVDTGLEFDETKANVKETAERFSLEMVVESAGDSFWDNLDYFGPPGKDFRWCCKICKLGPAVRLIQKHFPEGVLSFIGQRAYESEQRARKGRTWKNPWTPNQHSASPIQDWSAMHVWLYLFWKKAPFNPLYERGLERIGCFMCPATDLGELNRIKAIAGEYERWQAFLDTYADRTGRSPEWTRFGLWRWRRVPKSVRDELEGMLPPSASAGDGESTSARPLSFRSTSGYNPCIEGLSMEGVFSRPLDMDAVANLLNAIGEVTTSPDGSIAEVGGVTVFGEGPVMIKAKTDEDLERKASALREIVFRAMECAGCGICAGRCAEGAISVDGRARIDPTRCSHCGACLGRCPVTSFREQELDI